jgi:hypothetical protein
MKITTSDGKVLSDWQGFNTIVSTIQNSEAFKTNTVTDTTKVVSPTKNRSSSSVHLSENSLSQRKVISPKKMPVVSTEKKMNAILDRLMVCHCNGIYRKHFGNDGKVFTEKFVGAMTDLLNLLKVEATIKQITASQVKNALMWMDTVLQSVGHMDEQWETVADMIEELTIQKVW